MADENNKDTVSRRAFLKNSGLAVGGLVVGGVAGSLITYGAEEKKVAPKRVAQKAQDYNQALMHFTQDQFRMVEAATERIFPKDSNGPGAKELGVAYYIDHQLAGDWGFNARDYMQPPFYHGEKVQGYQGRLKRREVFNIALQEMNNYSHKKYKKDFIDLTDDQQDQVLKDFESDKVSLSTISASGFFNMLRSATLEGVYSDPLYGGNKNMDGWRMKHFPGNQMSYADVIPKGFQKIPPKSLRDHMSS
ncbi:gluconate 2-dehydrogenase subunit 3 family protein [Camelliibacillus cellulosilyticus]|uniref:Gluconate 2-dehydrogenase subunit 3 family protein n=1 Tax=Camelliibacillus cellulosilyticus TaxID=2174486 RepID=A0ABV9GGW8_9BACL